MHSLRRVLPCLLMLFAGLVLSLTARAADLQGSLQLQLIAPGGDVSNPGSGYSFSQLVDPAVGVLPGDGSDIGAYLLDAEFIQFVGQAIHLRLAAGADIGGQFSTGFLGANGEHARYVFGSLSVAGQQIVGLTASAFDGFAASGFSGIASPASPAAYVQWLGNGSLSVNLDELLFVDRGLGGANNYADLRIELLTVPVPEPATALLLPAGLLVLWLRRRTTPC
jgi:hypothetical protein